jgi:hypothetical protein
MGAIYARKKGDKTYYVYQEAYRVKLDPSTRGKERGSGKSAVRTRATYLGTAESIMERLQRTKEPLSVSSQPFGLVAAAYQTAVEIGLTDILRLSGKITLSSLGISGSNGVVPFPVEFMPFDIDIRKLFLCHFDSLGI